MKAISKIVVGIWLWILVAVELQALPESPHPYPNNFDQTQVIRSIGARALEIQFCARTYMDDGDFIILTDVANRVVGRYSGSSLAGQTLLIEGDCVHIRLVSNETSTSYGYAVTNIRIISAQDFAREQEVDYSNADKLFNQDLKNELYNLVKDHVCLGYTGARQKMFGQIDNENGSVQCVYTGRWVQTTTIPDANDMNTEHTWPKSLGAQNDPAASDLFHLFPTDNAANSKRANYPFGVVVTTLWEKGGSLYGKNANGQIVFMPRPEHRGNAARAMFYFSVRYQLSIDSTQEPTLRAWHNADPVDSKESARNNSISTYQKKRNPFIDHPEYVTRIDDF